MLELAPQNGNVSVAELRLLVDAVRQRCPARLFEFGTFDGRTTLNLAAASPPDAQVFTLDLLPEHLSSLRFAPDPYDGLFYAQPNKGWRYRAYPDHARKIRQLWGDSAGFDFAPYEGRMDFVFVDGSHALECVRSDTANAFRMLSPGGIIYWHDATPAAGGVWQVLQELGPAVQYLPGTSLAYAIDKLSLGR